MMTPFFLMGAALLFWGWNTGLWIFAGFMMVILEASRAISWRLDLEERDYHRTWDLCALLFTGVAIYCYATEEPAHAIYKLVQWMPLIFFPFMFAQAYGSLESIPFRTFSWLVRSKSSGQDPLGASLNISFPYFALCLVAASATNEKRLWFYFFLCLILAAVLWVFRPRRFSPLLWLSLLAAVAVGGYFSHIALSRLHALVEQKSADWLNEYTQSGTMPDQSRTSLGSLGKSKLSGKIVLRLTSEKSPPGLLHQASYTTFNRTVWYALQNDFSKIFPEADGRSWKLSPSQSGESEVTISGFFTGPWLLLPHPPGSSRLTELPATQVETNRFGAYRAALEKNYLNFHAHFSRELSRAAPPDEADLVVPSQEKVMVKKWSDRLGLDPSPATVQKLEQFFQNQFQYRTHQEQESLPRKGETPLAAFLDRTKAGHCEYFASATVLLLREAGIPARYSTGYSVQEKAGEQLYLVRGRHAHSWASAYFDGRWVDVDTTPSGWAQADKSNTALWEPFSDIWSRGLFSFAEWRAREKNLGSLFWLLAPVIGFIVWKFLRVRKKAQRPADLNSPVAARSQISSHGFGQVEKVLDQAGFPRLPWETLATWLERLETKAGLDVASLQEALKLHYRLRFDPLGLPPTEQSAMERTVKHWLEKWRKREGLK